MGASSSNAQVLEEIQKLTLTDLVLDISHEWPKAWLVATVRVAQHATLQEILLLWILLQGEEELSHIVVFLHVNTSICQPLLLRWGGGLRGEVTIQKCYFL